LSLIHDVIKIKYVEEGYLPNYPYHMISDIEMCDAFMPEAGDGYFQVNYPCLDMSLDVFYNYLVEAIRWHIQQLKDLKEVDYKLPNWIYTYMLGKVISVNSPVLDIHDLISLLGVDNLDDEFGTEQSAACLQESINWLRKTRIIENPISVVYGDETIIIDMYRPPSQFGEPHVIKSVRLRDSDPMTEQGVV